MPEQLLLLDDQDTSRSSGSLIWSQLPIEVRAELTAKLAELLLRIVRPSVAEEELADDTL
jgi:hypothetical protein